MGRKKEVPINEGGIISYSSIAFFCLGDQGGEPMNVIQHNMNAMFSERQLSITTGIQAKHNEIRL